MSTGLINENLFGFLLRFLPSNFGRFGGQDEFVSFLNQSLSFRLHNRDGTSSTHRIDIYMAGEDVVAIVNFSRSTFVHIYGFFVCLQNEDQNNRFDVDISVARRNGYVLLSYGNILFPGRTCIGSQGTESDPFDSNKDYLANGSDDNSSRKCRKSEREKRRAKRHK